METDTSEDSFASNEGISRSVVETSAAGGSLMLPGLLLLIFLILWCLMPLRTAVRIGADEGIELAKATLCLNGYKLYTQVWNDQPPLYTFLITEALKHFSPSVLIPRIITVAFGALLVAAVYGLARRINGVAVAVLAAGMLIASPGFVTLSSSCMLEVPALAPAVAALWALAAGFEWRLQPGAGDPPSYEGGYGGWGGGLVAEICAGVLR